MQRIIDGYQFFYYPLVGLWCYERWYYNKVVLIYIYREEARKYSGQIEVFEIENDGCITEAYARSKWVNGARLCDVAKILISEVKKYED